MTDGWFRGPQWASPAAEAEWKDRVAAAAKAWEEIEVLSVSEGLRSSALVYLTPEELVRATAAALAQGLQVVPMEWGAGSVRAAVCWPEVAKQWPAAWRAKDSSVIGKLLGFPECCTAFFDEVWNKQGLRDTTGPMAAGQRLFGGPDGANILLRRLGVRLVPHLPCSFNCWATEELARLMMHAAKKAGIEDVAEIKRLLALPMTWSAWGGAAVVLVEGVMRFSYQTDQTFSEDVVMFHREGTRPEQLPPPVWRDNGFSTREAMDAAHAVVAQAVAAGGEISSAVDLGAGDGALLERLAAGREGTWSAVEADAARSVRGQQRRPALSFTRARIEDLEVAPGSAAAALDLALLMPGRLLEMEAAAAARVRRMLPELGRRLVVYAYGDWIARGGVAKVFQLAGLPGQLGPVYTGPGVEVAEVCL